MVVLIASIVGHEDRSSVAHRTSGSYKCGGILLVRGPGDPLARLVSEIAAQPWFTALIVGVLASATSIGWSRLG